VIEATKNPALDAWVGLLRTHRAAVRDLGSGLVQEHGLSINDYEALYLLAESESGRLRRTDLAESLQLTPSGVTRLLEGLERSGLVRKAECASDARVAYAVLTDAGRERLDIASRSHLAAIEELFHGHLEAEEVEQLSELLGRLPGAGPRCSLG
jgi:DNA-binding MarR family transcriptional regulator